MRVQIIPIPYDSGRRGERMGAGPGHLLSAGLAERLRDAGHDVHLTEIAVPADRWLTEVGSAFALAAGTAAAVRDASDAGVFPLVLSGNCGPAAIGSTAGLQPPTAIYWFDAHGDLNTPETTASGFVDGMALATLTGRCWSRLASAVPGFHAVPERDVVLIGARDLDPAEVAVLKDGSLSLVEAGAVRARLKEVLTRRDGPPNAYVHVDLDVLDSTEVRVNEFAAPHGMSCADLEWALTTIALARPVSAAALTAYDPGADPSDTAAMAAIRVGTVLVDAVARAREAQSRS